METWSSDVNTDHFTPFLPTRGRSTLPEGPSCRKDRLVVSSVHVYGSSATVASSPLAAHASRPRPDIAPAPHTLGGLEKRCPTRTGTKDVSPCGRNEASPVSSWHFIQQQLNDRHPASFPSPAVARRQCKYLHVGHGRDVTPRTSAESQWVPGASTLTRRVWCRYLTGDHRPGSTIPTSHLSAVFRTVLRVKNLKSWLAWHALGHALGEDDDGVVCLTMTTRVLGDIPACQAVATCSFSDVQKTGCSRSNDDATSIAWPATLTGLQAGQGRATASILA